MARYIDAEYIPYTLMHGGSEITTKNEIDMVPTADVVEIETVRKWLYEIAWNNIENLDDACEEIISRLDGLRRFAEEKE